MLTRVLSLWFTIWGRQMERARWLVWRFPLRRKLIALKLVPLATAWLILPSPLHAQDVTINIKSDTSWTVTDANGVFLGNAQNVCLNSTAPPNCPAGATLFGYPGFAWTANLSSIPGAAWIWAPKNSAMQKITGTTTGAAGATFTFTKQFFLCGTPKDGKISIASDDSAQVFLNGSATPVATSSGWSALTTVTVPASNFAQGPNTIKIVVTNAADPPDCTSDQYQCNPAGVVLGGTFADVLNQWPTCTNPNGNVGDVKAIPNSCPPGQGSLSQICMCFGSNAFWFGPVGMCTAPTCTDTVNGTVQTFNVNDVETLPCGSPQTGNKTRTCTANGWGTWNTGMCVTPTTCIGNNGHDNGQVFMVGQTQPIDCPAGKVGSLTETCQANGTWSAPAGTCSCAAGAPACGTSCCSAGQLCCRVNGVSACVTPGGPRSGSPWCGQSAPTVIECNNCTSTQTCGSICSGRGSDRLCSVDWYCQ